MNFQEATQYLYSLGNEMLAMKLGLESIRLLSNEFESPQKKYPAIHIAGTNGKGSTSAMVERMARSAGLRTGLFTSPHLLSITERMRVNGKEIPKQEFAALAAEVRAACDRLVELKRLPARPSFFEHVTMIAYLHFTRQNVDLAVLEVGLGGRLDATNICAPTVTAITPVAYDHQQYLGHSLTEIAGEKAGIIKPEIPVVVAPQAPEAMSAIQRKSDELNAPLISVAQEIERGELQIDEQTRAHDVWKAGMLRFRYRSAVNQYDARLRLRGRHQIVNAVTAITIAEEANRRGLKIPRDAVIEGLEEVQWPGRLELVSLPQSEAPLLLDGAHNAAGASVLADFLREFFFERPITLLFAAMTDKAIADMSQLLFPLAARIVITRVKSPRAADPHTIVLLAGPKAVIIENTQDALEEAIRMTPASGLICACGSLFLIGEIRDERL
jgi:dihydrofolate synthase/folylpolyglutamate synthase